MKAFLINKSAAVVFYLVMVYSMAASFGTMAASQGTTSATLPEPPDNCFQNRSYCTNTEIVNEDGRRLIKVTLHAQISGDIYSSANDIRELYLDFDKWGEYLKDSEVIKMIKTIALPSIEINGKTIYRHYVHYTARAPFPLITQKVRMVAHYQDLDPSPYQDAELSVRFDAITDKDHQIDGEEPLKGAEGLKFQTGDLFVKHDKENNQFLIYSVTKVVPGIDLLPSIAAPYVEDSVVALLKGILSI